jgi:flavin-binding protein dodecin
MPESEYDIVELVGTSEKSWEDAVQSIISQAAKTIRDLRIAEIVRLDARIDNQKIVLYRARIKLSFKLETKVEESEPTAKKIAVEPKAKKAAKKS